MIEELTLQSFKSYSSRQTINFTSGVNKISGRNASGKTTLLEAILFGLFGEVPGVSKQDLVPLGGGNLYVSVVFRSPHSGWRVRIVREGALGKDGSFRTSTLYLEVEGEDHPYVRERDVQGKIRDLLGVGKRVFFNVVYAKQKEFVEILNPPRGRMDAILGLTTPAEVKEELREVRKELEARGKIGERGAVEERMRIAAETITEARRQIEQVEARRSRLKQQIVDINIRLSAARAKVEKIEVLEARFRQLEGQRTELQVLRGRLEDRHRDLVDLITEIGEKPEETRTDLQAKLRATESLEERLRRIVDEEIGKERRDLDGEIARLSHQINEHLDLKKQGVAICPKCGQKVDYGLLEEDLTHWQKELQIKKARLTDLEGELKLTREQMRLAQERRIDARQAITRFEDQLRKVDDLKAAISQIEREAEKRASRVEIENIELKVNVEDELATTISSLDEGERLITERLKRARDELSSVQADLRSAEALLKDTERQQAEVEQRISVQRKMLDNSKATLDLILEYEAKIRTLEAVQGRYVEYERQLRDNALRQLEWLTGKYFDRLTDQRVYAGCHINRENYELEVRPIGRNRLLAAWRAGGGHESLFALSERLALLRVMGFPHLLILDEPTDAVDSENIPQLLEYIARSSHEIGQVLLVTHHGFGEEEGVNLIRVRKVDGESRVSQETPQIQTGD